MSSPGVFTEVIHLFLATDLSPAPSSHEAAEVIEVHWLALDEAYRWALDGTIRDGKTALGVLRASDINWTYLSPAAYFVPGKRTGKFRLGTNELISDAKGESKISFADYAIALVDEIEKPAHERASFSVGY